MKTKKEPLVKMINIKKKFGAVQALKDVNFEVYPDEIVGLVGDNGAGKSTLMRILSGIYHPTEGKIYFQGKEVSFSSPMDARIVGIETVHQGFGLLELMNVSRNMFLGAEPVKKFGPLRFLDLAKMETETRGALEKIGIKGIKPNYIISYLSGGQRQAIKIGRAMYFKAKLILLDEPHMALSVRERDKIWDLIMELKKKRVSAVYISHDIRIVYDLADRFVILDAGNKVGEFEKGEISLENLTTIIRKGKIDIVKEH
ncbi:sugar ABC transporter ATP-binding protein [Patescibacteria group bacterium]|nr:sugar ABC transporter ATP-binding protein [Patescibacteria group bacterium]